MANLARARVFVDSESHESLARAVTLELGEAADPDVYDVVLLRIRALDVASVLDAPDLLADQRGWEEARLAGLHTTTTVEQLDEAIVRVLAETVDADRLERARELISGSAVHVAAMCAQRSMSHTELDPRARRYLYSALAKDGDAAMRVVQDEILHGASATDVLLTVLQPAQIEVGRLWATGEIDIPDEQYVTTLTQRCILLLNPALPRQRRANGPRVVSVAVGRHAHEMGLKMVTTVMQHAGWQTAYLGNDVSAEHVARFVQASRPDVLALSVTMSAHVRDARDVIAAVRATPRCEDVHILVGGHPFTLNPQLAELVGADDWARDAREALEVCERLLDE